MTPTPTVPQTPPAPAPHNPELELLRTVREMAFGTVEVTVHQSRIVQITRSEKVRFDPH